MTAVPATPKAEHHHSDVSGGWLRAATFGAMDGLVTNIALIAGVGGGGVSPHTIVLTGVAGLVAGAVSMGLGEYTSVRTSNEQVAAELDKELRELRNNPDAEADELPSPWTAAFSSFVCFSIGALIPLITYLLGFDDLWPALGVGGLGLFGAGALVARFTGKRWWLSGVRQLALGALAAAITYAIGALIGVGVS